MRIVIRPSLVCLQRLQDEFVVTNNCLVLLKIKCPELKQETLKAFCCDLWYKRLCEN